MGSFYAELHVAGHAFPVRRADFSVHQDTDHRGRVIGKVRHGPLYVTMDVPREVAVLEDWAAAPYKPLPGQLVFYDATAQIPQETIGFAAGHCTHYGEEFDNGRNGGSAAYVCRLTISAEVFELLAGGVSARASPAVAAAVSQVVKAAAAPRLASAPAGPAVAGWLVDLETVLGPAAGVRSLVASWVAGGLSEDKIKSAIRGSVDQQLVFERLVKAGDVKGKGIFQQRVIVDDFMNIPGVVKAPYVDNSLPEKELLASAFGVTDPRFNLPPKKAATFTGSAELREINPGEKLYRVTSDPTNDPRGKTGGYWTRTPPASLAEVIGGTAVMPEWNNFQRVYEFTAPPYADPVNKEPKFYVWEGPAAAQPVSNDYEEKKDNGYHLPGGEPQAFISNHLAWSEDFPTHIVDISSAHKKW